MSGTARLSPEGKRGKQLSGFDRLLAKFFTGTHRNILKLTGSRVMSRMGGNEIGILTTTGRKSGRPRSHPVITVPDGADRLIVATNAGAANHPYWVRNVLADPKVELSLRGTTHRMTARVVGPDEKRELWPRLVEAYRMYDTMQNKTDRDIPVVRLSPA
ncbi:nitroreductase/quinone reductase family protein [Actinokineospora enzanensis]|uniref:nitroreductase/quinone reductase family protein n=1 Tax=Actinokineospora enzanensis TaxID=155975 RepID=UPI00036537C4|nr:nitroreductase/quinone reductase family protein [Actinokineospora enzanensis]